MQSNSEQPLGHFKSIELRCSSSLSMSDLHLGKLASMGCWSVIPFCLIEVQVVGKVVNRDTLINNKSLVKLAVEYLGTRVSVPTCQCHISALYSYMEIPCPSNLPSKMFFLSSLVKLDVQDGHCERTGIIFCHWLMSPINI